MLQSQITVFISHSPPPSLVRKASFVSSWYEELGQFLDTGRPNASMRLFLNVLQSVCLWVTAVLTSSIGILCLHLVPRPLVTWASSGIRGKWLICNWRRWDRPRLVLRLAGNLLQYGDTLLLVSQVVHLAPRHWMALTISFACKQAVERTLHLKQFWWCRPWCTGWTACLWARSIPWWLWAAFRWCLRRTTIGATCTGACCAWAARWGTGQRHWRLTSGGLRHRLRTGRLRVTGWRLRLSEVWMPCVYPCLLDWNEQIWVSHVQFVIPPVSSRGVTSGLPSRWYWYSAGCRVVPKPFHLGLSAQLDPPVWHCLWN